MFSLRQPHSIEIDLTPKLDRNPTMEPAQIPVLPGNTGLHYLSEGAANIVYHMFVIYPKPATPQPAELDDYGDGTPPPTEIEVVGGLNKDLDFFDSKFIPSSNALFTSKIEMGGIITHVITSKPNFKSTADILKDKLLRVRKNLHTTFPCAVAQSNWLRLIAPLFPEDQLVIQSLVDLRTGNIIARLNKQLEGWEQYEYPIKGSPRPTKRRGIYLADDDHGLLVTAMTPGTPSFRLT